MPRKRISSYLTIVYKFISPLFWTFATVNLIRYTANAFFFLEDPAWIIPIYLVALIALPLNVWLFFRVKKVELDANNMYVSNYRKEIVIPLSDVYSVAEMRWIAPFWITFRLERPSEFGDTIVFVPPYRQWAFWTKNPLVDELKELVASKRTSRFIPPIPEKRLF